MKSNYKIAAAVIGSFVLGVGAASVLHAASEPYAITVSEINVKDTDAYTAWLPDVQKTIADAGGKYIGGGFNKTTPMIGEPPPNRVVLIQYPSMTAAKKWFDDYGGPALKKAEAFASFRVYGVEGIEQK
jgi:uncharacterized protein (DUF1330 family)